MEKWPNGRLGEVLLASRRGDTGALTKRRLRAALLSLLGARVTAIRMEGAFVYAGLEDGRLIVSADGGLNWRTFAISQGGAVQSFWVDAEDPRIAVAVLESNSAPLPVPSPRVLRTFNGGVFWDDLTGNLPEGSANGVTASRTSRGLYVATAKGVYFATTNLEVLGQSPSWRPMAGLLERRQWTSSSTRAKASFGRWWKAMASTPRLPLTGLATQAFWTWRVLPPAPSRQAPWSGLREPR